MRNLRRPEDRYGRCPKCGAGMEFEGPVNLGDDDQGFQILAAFRCRVCNHGLIDFIGRVRAKVLESQLQAVN